MRKGLFVAVAAAVAGVLAVGSLRAGDQTGHVTLEPISGEVLASDADTLLVDIRTPQEWVQTGVIDGALLVTYQGADAFLAAVAPYLKPGQRLALICRTGNRTSRAARQIAGKVDTQVVDVAGGMVRVLREGYQPVAPLRENCPIC